MELLKRMEKIVRRAGEIILSAQDIGSGVREKTGAVDLVTEYDIRVENFLKERLPELVEGSAFFGEEEEENQNPGIGWVFIADPIDGTMNFVRGHGRSAVSAALVKDGQAEYAVVFDPYRDEMFTAKRGAGAFLNGERMYVSTLPLSKGIFGLGAAPFRQDLHPKTMEVVRQLFDRSCDFRRSGSAVLDLCSVACGRLEVLFEYQLSQWDYAAASLLITEAGGFVSTMEGKPLSVTEKGSVWASNAVNAEILKELTV